MRFPRQPDKQRQRQDLMGRIGALEREVAQAATDGDLLAQAVALNNIGGAWSDLREWAKSIEAYLQAAELVPADASLDDRLTPWGNAAASARKLDQWEDALLYALRVDALATAAQDPAQQSVADQMVALVRRHFGKKEFAPVLDAAIGKLPEEQAAQVRRDHHADPTVRGEDK